MGLGTFVWAEDKFFTSKMHFHQPDVILCSRFNKMKQREVSRRRSCRQHVLCFAFFVFFCGFILGLFDGLFSLIFVWFFQSLMESFSSLLQPLLTSFSQFPPPSFFF